MYVCVCVRMRARTHTLYMGNSDVNPRVGTKHLKSPKNLDGLNLGIYVSVYVYKVCMCIYVLRGVMRSCTTCFFL